MHASGICVFGRVNAGFARRHILCAERRNWFFSGPEISNVFTTTQRDREVIECETHHIFSAIVDDPDRKQLARLDINMFVSANKFDAKANGGFVGEFKFAPFLIEKAGAYAFQLFIDGKNVGHVPLEIASGVPSIMDQTIESEARHDLAILPPEHIAYLMTTWKRQTRLLSSVSKKVSHPLYRQLMSLGIAAVAPMLKDLKDNGPAHWFCALNAITGTNPVSTGMAGNMTAMTEAWIKWGVEAGYLKD